MTHSADRFSQPVSLSFFRRQWLAQRTTAQDKFDIFFGIVVPILCFKFDPIVFKGGFSGFQDGMLGDFQLLVYAISSVQIVVLIAWMLFRRRLASMSAPIGGILIAGGVMSAVIGILILPLTLLGLIMLIGVLGFTPFVVACVYIRAGLRAIWEQEQNSVFRHRFALAPLAAVVSISLTALAVQGLERVVSTSVAQIVSGDAQRAERAMTRLTWMPFLPEVELQPIVREYAQEQNVVRRETLSRYYRKLSGEEIEFKLRVMND